MAFPVFAWWPFKRRRRDDPFTRATRDDLDIVMPPPYDMAEVGHAQARSMVENQIASLHGGLDAGSREVLNNLINAWADRAIAQLDNERDERQAVGEVLIGLARQDVARRKTRYDADLAAALHAREALGVSFEALTGKESADSSTPFPGRFDENPIRSTLGPVDLNDIAPRSAEASAPQSTSDELTSGRGKDGHFPINSSATVAFESPPPQSLNGNRDSVPKADPDRGEHRKGGNS